MAGPEVWAAIRSDPGNVSLNTCKEERRKLDWIRAVGLPAGLFSDIAPKIVAGCRARVAVEAPSHLRDDHPEDGRWTLMGERDNLGEATRWAAQDPALGWGWSTSAGGVAGKPQPAPSRSPFPDLSRSPNSSCF